MNRSARLLFQLFYCLVRFQDGNNIVLSLVWVRVKATRTTDLAPPAVGRGPGRATAVVWLLLPRDRATPQLV